MNTQIQRNKDTAQTLWDRSDCDPLEARLIMGDVKHWQGPAPFGALEAWGPRGGVARQSGPYLRQPATGAAIDVSGLEFWRCTGDRFKENRVFVDRATLFSQIGVELFDHMQEAA